MAEQLAQHIDALVEELQRAGLLDEQFSQLMQLQDESNPDFVVEVVELYFSDSVSKIDQVSSLLATGSPDFNEVDQLVHQFKGSSASLGATAISQLCISMREACHQQNRSACQALVLQIHEAFATLKGHLDLFVQLETQRKALLAGGSAPP